MANVVAASASLRLQAMLSWAPQAFLCCGAAVAFILGQRGASAASAFCASSPRAPLG